MAISWINAEDLGLALRRSRTLHRRAPKVVAGLNKAAIELIGGAVWSYDLTADVLTISSATNHGVSYTVSFLECTCAAAKHGRMCWHSYARDLISFTVQIGFDRTVAPKGILSLDDAEYAELLAKVDELW